MSRSILQSESGRSSASLSACLWGVSAPIRGLGCGAGGDLEVAVGGGGGAAAILRVHGELSEAALGHALADVAFDEGLDA